MPGYSGQIGIERRGHSSQQLRRRSRSRSSCATRSGEDRKAPLLGMPADGDWVLYAPYERQDADAQRRSPTRPRARSGRYAPRTRFVKLHLNGRYHGIYVLTEKVELGEERVQGDALRRVHVPGPGARRKNPSFRGPVRKRPIVWEDPERKDLLARQANAIAAPVRAAERALYGRGSWRPYIDEAAAVDFVLLQELFKNQDAFLGCRTCVALRRQAACSARSGTSTSPLGNAGSGASQCSSGWMLKRRHWAGRLCRTRASSARSPPAGRSCARPGCADLHARDRRGLRRAARRGRAQLHALAGAAPPPVAQRRRPRQSLRRGPSPAHVAGPQDRLDRPERGLERPPHDVQPDVAVPRVLEALRQRGHDLEAE